MLGLTSFFREFFAKVVHKIITIQLDRFVKTNRKVFDELAK